ncbi:MAG: lysophospholipid acyltransferase family protein [Eubacteriales bacterium]|jgi:1-acyl-sn-glycerol-3-phosphate acyltransferase|nr:lysophospholipid acyltransferase family protein [Eubacteriales bacterium]
MKIIQNIPGIIKVLGSLPELGKLKKEIDAARAAGDDAREQEAILAATNMWGNHLMRSFHIDLSVYGRENIPKKGEGPLVYVSNHQGFADIPTLCAVLTNVQFGFIAKDTLKKIPLYGTWMQRIRSVMIEREDPRASLRAIAKGIDYIEHGFSILVFPEGTRARGGDMHEFKKGSLKLATKPGVPIVPISINGTYEVLEKDGYLHSAPIDVMVHPAIETKGLSRKEDKELTDKVYDIVRGGLMELKAMRQNQ